MVPTQRELQAVANEFLYSDLELSFEERRRFENLDFTFEYNSDDQIIIIM